MKSKNSNFTILTVTVSSADHKSKRKLSSATDLESDGVNIY